MPGRYHLDTDFLVRAVTSPRHVEAERLDVLEEGGATFEMSAVAWYEFARGPRTPEQLAAAQAFLGRGAILGFTELAADRAADIFRRRKAKKRRAGDVAIAAVALLRGATLLTGNPGDFEDIDGLDVDRAH